MFPDFKTSFPKNSFWQFNLDFVFKTFNLDTFQITEKKQQTKNNNFLTNIWRDNWRFINCRRKRTPLKCLSLMSSSSHIRRVEISVEPRNFRQTLDVYLLPFFSWSSSFRVITKESIFLFFCLVHYTCQFR